MLGVKRACWLHKAFIIVATTADRSTSTATSNAVVAEHSMKDVPFVVLFAVRRSVD